MKTIERIRGDFEEKAKQPGYSVDEFIRVAASFGSTLYTRTVRAYASENDLRRDLRKMRINLTGSSAIYLIPESKLEALMEGMGVRATVEDFQEELELQRERASALSNVNRSKKRRVNRYG